MLIIEIAALDNGAHRNQNGSLSRIPDGWAVVPESVGTAETLENFPFGEITLDENAYVPTVAMWSPLPVPEPVPEPEPQPTTEERVAALEAENKLLKEQVSAQADQAEFYEDCIAEMAMVVYA